jgi:hypothetical protein
MPLIPSRPRWILGRDAQPEKAREVGVYVPVHEVFPGTTGTARELMAVLRTLSRDDTLFQCARINTIVSGSGDFENTPRQQQAAGMLCNQEQIGRINDFARRHKTSGPPLIFFRGQMLELMRCAATHCQNLPADGTTYTDPAFRERFLKAALIASDLWAARTFRDTLSAPGDAADIRLRAIGALRKGVEETNLAPHIGVAIGRGLKLFSEYLPRRAPGFPDLLSSKTGLTTRQYLSCASALLMFTLQRSSDGPLFNRHKLAPGTAAGRLFQTFIDLIAQTPEQLGAAFTAENRRGTFQPIRERPVMTTGDGRCIVLDPAFFIECVSVGALFQAVRGAGRKESRQLFSDFGYAFEAYATDILARMYPRRPGLIDRMASNVRGRDGSGNEFEIDASLTDVSQAILFEMKAVFLLESAVTDPDPQAFLGEIRAKYGASNRRGERDKGVAQLARSAGAIVRGEWSGTAGEYASVNVIHPVLLAHDPRLDAPALGLFLESEFRSLLGPVPRGKHVRPLTVMTIQDLENLEQSVNSFSFVQLLDDYTRECPDRMRSLHNFIAFSHYGPKILPSPSLIEASVGIVDALRQELFPSGQGDT